MQQLSLLARLLLATLFFSMSLSSAFAQNRPAVRGIELEALVRLILLPARASYNVSDWAVGAQAGSPINWLHAGIEDAGDKGSLDYGAEFPFIRRGESVVLINGKPSHQVLGRRVEPGLWDISLLGARAGVMAMTTSPQSNSYELPDLLAYLRQKGFALKLLKCFDEPASSGEQVYRMSLRGYKPAYLRYTWSSGSAGLWAQLHITDDQAVMNSTCMGE